MNALAFDSLSYSRRLQGAGFTREQADALADEQAKLLDERLTTKVDLENVRALLARDLESSRESLARDIDASRVKLERDLDASRAKLQHDIEFLRVEVKRDIEVLRGELLKWFVGVIGVQTLTLLAAMFGFVRMLVH